MTKHEEYMERALMAEFNPLLERLFADMRRLMPMNPDNELIPGRDDLEDENA